MNQHKIIGDWILATKDTIFVLQQWRDLLVKWQMLGEVEGEAFAEACQQLREAGLWGWVNEAGGHGIEALVKIGASNLDVIQFIHGNATTGQLTGQSGIGRNQREG
jgi:hypothetical protein